MFIEVKVFIDGNKRQVYLIINYVMFEILLCICTWYRSWTLAFYMTFHNVYKNQQHRNDIAQTSFAGTWLFSQCTNRLQTWWLEFG